MITNEEKEWKRESPVVKIFVDVPYMFMAMYWVKPFSTQCHSSIQVYPSGCESLHGYHRSTHDRETLGTPGPSYIRGARLRACYRKLMPPQEVKISGWCVYIYSLCIYIYIHSVYIYIYTRICIYESIHEHAIKRMCGTFWHWTNINHGGWIQNKNMRTAQVCRKCGSQLQFMASLLLVFGWQRQMLGDLGLHCILILKASWSSALRMILLEQLQNPMVTVSITWD